MFTLKHYTGARWLSWCSSFALWRAW